MTVTRKAASSDRVVRKGLFSNVSTETSMTGGRHSKQFLKKHVLLISNQRALYLNISSFVLANFSIYSIIIINSNWFRQESSIDVKWNVMRNKIHNFKLLQHKLFINYKGKKSNFTVEKSGMCHVNQVFGIIITNNEISWHHMLFLWHIISTVFLPQIYNLNLIMKKCQTNLNLWNYASK